MKLTKWAFHYSEMLHAMSRELNGLEIFQMEQDLVLSETVFHLYRIRFDIEV